MAEEQDNSQKTEDPTQKRLEEARKKGDIAKSQDVPIWFLMNLEFRAQILLILVYLVRFL